LADQSVTAYLNSRRTPAMAFVKKRGSKWSAVIRDRVNRNPVWITLHGVTTKTEAKRIADQMQTDLDRERLTGICREQSTRYSDLMINFLKHRLPDVKTEQVKNQYAVWLTEFQAFLMTDNIQHIHEVQHTHCRKFMDMLRDEKHHGTETRRKRHGLLKSLFDFAVVEYKGINANPWNKVKKPAKGKPKKEFFSPDAFRRIIEVAKTRDNADERATLWHVLYCTGARPKEVAGLRWSDIEFFSREITFQNVQKGQGVEDDIRTIPMHSALIPILKKIRPKQASGYVFDGQKYKDKWSGYIERDAKMAGVADGRSRHANLTMFRHGFSTFLKDAGVPMYLIKMSMGHSQNDTTINYMDGNLETLRGGIEKIKVPGSERIANTQDLVA
jgi:integrase